MNTKLIGAAVAAALLGLSTASFGQGAGASASGASGASGQDSARQAGQASPSAGASGSGAVTSGSGAAVGTTGTTTTTSRCDTMTGAERTRCLRDERPSSGSSTAPGVPVTQEPAQSGAGAIDKTHPGQEPAGRGAINSRDAGTSSAGSGK